MYSILHLTHECMHHNLVLLGDLVVGSVFLLVVMARAVLVVILSLPACTAGGTQGTDSTSVDCSMVSFFNWT